MIKRLKERKKRLEKISALNLELQELHENGLDTKSNITKLLFKYKIYSIELAQESEGCYIADIELYKKRKSLVDKVIKGMLLDKGNIYYLLDIFDAMSYNDIFNYKLENSRCYNYINKLTPNNKKIKELIKSFGYLMHYCANGTVKFNNNYDLFMEYYLNKLDTLPKEYKKLMVAEHIHLLLKFRESIGYGYDLMLVNEASEEQEELCNFIVEESISCMNNCINKLKKKVKQKDNIFSDSLGLKDSYKKELKKNLSKEKQAYVEYKKKKQVI